jgi:Ca-activated chloride channel family protein
MPELFHFQQPEWFWLLVPLLALLWLWRQSDQQGSAWRRVCDARLLPYLLQEQGSRLSHLPLWLFAIGAVLALIALADPVWEKKEQPVFRNESARVVVLDLSNSMLSPDLKPTRLVRARYKVADILKQNLDGQTGLVVFAGDAFTVAPLTHDTDTIQALLSPLQPSLMPLQGSRVDLGLQHAAELMRQAGIHQGDVLLISDGFDGQRAIDTARQLHQEGYRVSVLGVGTDAGAPVPAGGGGFLRNQQGDIVVPALDQAALRQLAAAGGGLYTTISTSDSDIRRLLSQLSSQPTAGTEQGGMNTDTWQSNGPWLALLLIPLAALAFRRGWLLAVVVLVGSTVSAPRPAMALGWDDLWLRPDQQAARALQAGEAEQAAQLARDPALRGTAEYKAGNFDAALQAFAEQADVDADYNQGNALAQMKRYEEAIAAYDRALAKQPNMADALHNKAEIEKLLQQQQQQDQDQQQGESGEDADNQQGQQDQQQGESGEDADNQQGQQDQQQGESGEDADNKQGQRDQQNQQNQDAASEQAPQDDQASSGSQEDAQAGETDSRGAQQPDDASADEQQQADAEAAQDSPQSQAEAAAEQDTKQQAAEALDQPEGEQQTAAAEPLDTEEQRAAEQWLRRIPDDPGGLLRRKFLYQYKQRAGRSADGAQQTW